MTAAAIGAWTAQAGPGVVGTASHADTLARVARAADPGCDLVEVRLDYLLEAGGAWLGLCRELHAAGIPVILTLRHDSERGQWAGTNGERLDLLRQARDWVGCVDVEIQRDAVAQAVEDLPGITVMGSFHDFEGMPTDAELDDMVLRGAEAGAQIVKLACWMKDEAALDRMAALPARHPDHSLALVGMGPLGPDSRIRLPRAGSCLTYGFLDDAVAPGQVSAAELKNALA